MKPRIFKNWLLSLLIIAPGLLMANGGALLKTEFKKEINKEFSVNMQDKLLISNRYGKVDIKTWNESKVTIDVTITVNARKQSEADEVFERIKIEMNQNGGLVSAKTEIEDKSSWSSWFGNSSDFKIDYAVRMPEAHHLDLSNKYGHSYVESFGGDGDMSIKYGDLYAGDVGGDFNLYLGYGNATVGNVKNASGDVKYSKLKLETCDDLKMEIKYSKLTLDKASSLKLTSGYDDLNLGDIGSISAYAKYSDFEVRSVKTCDVEAKYTDVSIDKLTDRGVFNLGYGGINIDYIAAGFSVVDITAKYAGVKLHPDPNSSYTLSAHARYASIHYPSHLKVERDIDKDTEHELTGYCKSKDGGKISVTSSHGSIKVY